MTGKRQHFIPRFLLEGFASHTVGNELFTWVYRKDLPPFNTNIINIGVEGYFYSNGNDTQADEIITQAEESFIVLVRRLRATLAGLLNDPQVPEMIAHFETRTRHLRENFLRTGNYLVSRLLDFIGDDQFFIPYLERMLLNDPSILKKAFANALNKRGIPNTILEPLLQLSYPHLPALIEQLTPKLPELALHLRSILPEVLSKAAKSAQIRFFKESLSPPVKVQRYKELTYTVVDIPEGGLILGDSIILFQVEGARPFKTFLDNKDILNAVFLPLNPRRFLVGTSRNFSMHERESLTSG